jgi:hypothetical protein
LRLRTVEFVVFGRRGDKAKDVELLVLRHEVTVRREAGGAASDATGASIRWIA